MAFFGLKRAWHSTLRVTRHAYAAAGLTAARFDLLYWLEPRTLFPPTQAMVRRALGVSRTTVSRMLKSLEELGLVSRQRDHPDRRQLTVRLTPQGLARVRWAIRRFIRSGAAKLAVDSALAGERWHDEGRACFHAMEYFESFIRGIRKTFGDSATLYYRWHPDD